MKYLIAGIAFASLLNFVWTGAQVTIQDTCTMLKTNIYAYQDTYHATLPYPCSR